MSADKISDDDVAAANESFAAGMRDLNEKLRPVAEALESDMRQLNQRLADYLKRAKEDE